MVLRCLGPGFTVLALGPGFRPIFIHSRAVERAVETFPEKNKIPVNTIHVLISKHGTQIYIQRI